MLRYFLLHWVLLIVLTPLQAAFDKDEPVETRPFQLSIFPFIGTEGVHTQNYIYNFSLNIFAGVTGGADGLELGGFANINRYSMKGFQGAGFANVVDGEADGFQAAGFANVVNNDAKVFQGAGFANIVNGDLRGFQGSGFANVVSGNARAFQVSGFANLANRLEGVQVAGFANVADRAEGIQAAGFVNVADRIEGIQAAGFVNVADRIEGVQAAGLVNVAKQVKGLQLGFINVADSIDGLPLGFLSIVRDGYRKVEFSGGDAMNLNLGFKIGVRRFYNFLTLGTQFIGNKSVFSYGYGIGSEFFLTDNRYLNVEIHSHQLIEDNWWNYERVNMLNQLRVSYATDMNERWQFFAGPVINFQVRRQNDEGNRGSNIAPYYILEFSGRNTVTRVWTGINAGFRFW